MPMMFLHWMLPLPVQCSRIGRRQEGRHHHRLWLVWGRLWLACGFPTDTPETLAIFAVI